MRCGRGWASWRRNSAQDPATRVVVVRGAGEHFCAGADITELNVRRDPDEASFSAVVAAAEAALAGVPKPTVAFISGDCIGGGCSIAIDCDLRVATSDARFGITPAKLGIVYPSGALERAAHLLGPAVTKRLLFTGDLMSVAEARRVGLVDEIVDVAGGEERLATLTGVLASRSLLTQAATKSMISEILTHGHVSPAVAGSLARCRRSRTRRCRRSRSVRREADRPLHVVGLRWRLGQHAASSARCPGRRWCSPCSPSSSSPCRWPG